MSLKLKLHTQPEIPLEAEVLTPARLHGLSESGIAALPVMHGSQQAAVGDFFHTQGCEDGEIRLRGDLSRVKLIGAGMAGGRMVIEGDVGAHLGFGMSGGEIIVKGSAGDWVGPEMSGGCIHIHGDAGHMVGSAYRGSPIGMRGGEIMITGSVRNEAGGGMRNGLIAIGGDSGDFTGVNMLAGTLMVLGKLGRRTGASMKRGTILSLHKAEMLPTFSYACRYQPSFVRFYMLHLKALGLPVDDTYMTGRYERWSGDGIELNRGEILLYAGQ